MLRNEAVSSVAIERLDMGADEGDRKNLPARKDSTIDTCRIGVSRAFAIAEESAADGRGCKRERPVEDAEEDSSPFRRPLKRPRLDLSIPATIHDISHLLADILEPISALERPVLRRVCRSWDFVLTQKSMTNNKICVVESSKKYHEHVGKEAWFDRLRRFMRHMDRIRHVVTPSTKTLVMLFPAVKDPKDRFDLYPRLLTYLRCMMAAPRVIMVNVASHHDALVPGIAGEVWDRPMDLQLINFSLLIKCFHPKFDADLPVVLIDKLSLVLPGSLIGNSQVILKALGRMIWPFMETQQLEWVVQNCSLLDCDYLIALYLARRRLELGVPLEHPGASSEDRIRRADHFALGVIACHLLVEARKGKVPPPPILFPGS